MQGDLGVGTSVAVMRVCVVGSGSVDPAPAPGGAREDSGRQQVEIDLPTTLPVVELIPEIARVLGLLEVADRGFRLTTDEGRVLTPVRSLSDQGIAPGCALRLVSGVDATPAPVYDDLVEAVEGVAVGVHAQPRLSSGAGLGIGASILALGAGFALRDAVPPVGAMALAVVLTAAGVALARAGGQRSAGLVVTWAGAGYAGVAGLLVASAGQTSPHAAAGVGLGTVGVVGMVGLGEGRALLLPVIVLGSGLIAVAAVVDLTTLGTPRVSGIVLAAMVSVAAVIAGANLSPSSPSGHHREGAGQPSQGSLIALVSVIVLLVALGPAAITVGMPGVTVTGLGLLATLLGLRRQGPEVGSGLGTVAVLALVSVLIVSVVVAQPGRRVDLATVLASAGTLGMAWSMAPGWVRSTGEVSLDRWEPAILTAMVPTGLLIGVVALVRG